MPSHRRATTRSPKISIGCLDEGASRELRCSSDEAFLLQNRVKTTCARCARHSVAPAAAPTDSDDRCRSAASVGGKTPTWATPLDCGLPYNTENRNPVPTRVDVHHRA